MTTTSISIQIIENENNGDEVHYSTKADVFEPESDNEETIPDFGESVFIWDRSKSKWLLRPVTSVESTPQRSTRKRRLDESLDDFTHELEQLHSSKSELHSLLKSSLLRTRRRLMRLHQLANRRLQEELADEIFSQIVDNELPDLLEGSTVRRFLSDRFLIDDLEPSFFSSNMPTLSNLIFSDD